MVRRRNRQMLSVLSKISISCITPVIINIYMHIIITIESIYLILHGWQHVFMNIKRKKASRLIQQSWMTMFTLYEIMSTVLQYLRGGLDPRIDHNTSSEVISRVQWYISAQGAYWEVAWPKNKTRIKKS